MSWAVLTKSSDMTIPTTRLPISWDAAEQSGGTFWDAGDPVIVTIGATEVGACFFFNCSIVNANNTRDILMEFFRNSVFQQGHTLDNPFFGSCVSYGRGSHADEDIFSVDVQAFGGTRTMEAEYSAFSMASPDRVGIITAECTDYDDSTGLLTWGAVVQSGYYLEQGSETFTVPAGVGAVIVSLSSSGSGSAALAWEMFVNDVLVRRNLGPINVSANASPASFGVVPVDEGDEITIGLIDPSTGIGSGTVTLTQSLTRLTIELLE